MTLYDVRGRVIEERVGKLPSGDLQLPDGRMLSYRGKWPMVPGARRYEVSDGMCVLASIDETPHGRLLHVSMSYQERNPTWEEIKAVRAVFYPETVDVMMMLPKSMDYVNVHAHTFHLWQAPREWGVQ